MEPTMKIQQSPVEYHAGGTAVSGLILHPRHWLALAFFAILSLFIVGCGGGGDGDPVFITDDGTIIGGDPADPSDPGTSDPAALPQVSLLGSDSVLGPGATTFYGLALDAPARNDLRVNLFVLGDVAQFEVSNAVTIPSGQSAVSFPVRASETAVLGSSIEITVVPGAAYNSSLSPVRVSVAAEDVATALPQLALLGGAGVDGAQQEPTKTLTPAEADQAGSTTTLALVLDRPAPEDITVNYVMVGNAEAFTVDGANALAGEPLLIPAGARVLPFTIQAVGPLFDAAQLQILGGEFYSVEGEDTASFVITLDRLPLAALVPNSLDVPVDAFRNAAVILDPERPPAPPEGLRINFVLVDDPLVVQEENDITPTPGDEVDGTDPVAGIIEVNNAQPLAISGGDFAVTFQVERFTAGTVTMILIGGDGYTVPAWDDPNAQLLIIGSE
jgi:hypothetical protein